MFFYLYLQLKIETQVTYEDSVGAERLPVPFLCVQITAANELPHRNHDPVINILALSPSYPNTRPEF